VEISNGFGFIRARESGSLRDDGIEAAAMKVGASSRRTGEGGRDLQRNPVGRYRFPIFCT
jgi:hypothetical protein